MSEALSKTITTHYYPIDEGSTAYGEGNWIMFNIYVNEKSRYHDREGPFGPITGTPLSAPYAYDLLEAADRWTDPNTIDTITDFDGDLGSITLKDQPERLMNLLRDFGSETRHLKISTSIGIYLPGNITAEHTIDWGNTEMGSLRTLGNSLGLVTGDRVFDSSADSIEATGGAIGKLLIRKAAGTLGNLVGIPIQDFVDKHQKQTINNHTELHFSGVGLRSFSFTFSFYPKNVEEAKTIENIIKVFKFHMYPELSDDTLGVYLLYPSYFDLSYMRNWTGRYYGPNTKVGRIGRCALTDLKVSHGEDSYVPIRGPNFATDPNDWWNSFTSLQLTFKELTQLTRPNIVEGY